MADEELLGCPFCGHDDELQVSHIGSADEWWWEVFCDHCCTHGPTAPTEAEAIAAWNHRAAHSVMAGRVAELTEALKPFAAADRALGTEPGPFRFETGTGYRAIDREDFRRAAAALAPHPERRGEP